MRANLCGPILLLALGLAVPAGAGDGREDPGGKKKRLEAEAPVALPPAPTGLQATPGDGTVTLSWNLVPEARRYVVKRGTTPGGPYAIIEPENPSTDYVDTGLTNGTTYYYVVRAANRSGESPDSGEVSATPLASFGVPPPAPTGLAALPGDRQITLTWSPVPGALSYTVRSATDFPGGPYGLVEAGFPGTVFIDDTLVNGTIYFYVITASNGAGESPLSMEVSAIPSVAAAPQPPGASPGGEEDDGGACGLLGMEAIAALMLLGWRRRLRSQG